MRKQTSTYSPLQVADTLDIVRIVLAVAVSVCISQISGMRLLLEEKANNVTRRVSSILADDSVNPFQLSPLNMRILSGEEEGAFAWVALNYLRGYFSGSNREFRQKSCVYIASDYTCTLCDPRFQENSIKAYSWVRLQSCRTYLFSTKF